MSHTEIECQNVIATMHAQGVKNDELISKAIQMLFFDLGENPTQQRVLNMVRVPGKSPSAATVQKKINEFWVELRSKLGVKIAHPELPADVLKSFEGVLANLWDIAQAGAQRSVAEYQASADKQIEEAKRQADLAVSLAEGESRAAKEQASAAMSELSTARDELTRATNQVSEFRARAQMLESSLADSHVEISSLNALLGTERQKLDSYKVEVQAEKDLIAKAHQDAIEVQKKEISKLTALLVANDDVIMRLKIDVRREIDKGEALRAEADTARQTLASYQQEFRTLQGTYTALVAEHAELKGRFKAINKVRQPKMRSTIRKG